MKVSVSIPNFGDHDVIVSEDNPETAVITYVQNFFEQHHGICILPHLIQLKTKSAHQVEVELPNRCYMFRFPFHVLEWEFAHTNHTSHTSNHMIWINPNVSTTTFGQYYDVLIAKMTEDGFPEFQTYTVSHEEIDRIHTIYPMDDEVKTRIEYLQNMIRAETDLCDLMSHHVIL